MCSRRRCTRTWRTRRQGLVRAESGEYLTNPICLLRCRTASWRVRLTKSGRMYPSLVILGRIDIHKRPFVVHVNVELLGRVRTHHVLRPPLRVRLAELVEQRTVEDDRV